jgi:DNA-binding response OmpR family regulator
MPAPNGDDAARATASTIRHGPFLLDARGYTVTVHGHDVPLTFTEFLLLTELASHPNRWFDRAALVAVLDERRVAHQYGTASPMTARTVDLHICRIRRKLKLRGYDGIQTMRFVGYRFVPVDQGHAAGAAPPGARKS